ncbi:hypothetical protein AHAS_Ahas03G0237700 [Arachis hypogaea]
MERVSDVVTRDESLQKATRTVRVGVIAPHEKSLQKISATYKATCSVRIMSAQPHSLNHSGSLHSPESPQSSSLAHSQLVQPSPVTSDASKSSTPASFLPNLLLFTNIVLNFSLPTSSLTVPSRLHLISSLTASLPIAHSRFLALSRCEYAEYVLYVEFENIEADEIQNDVDIEDGRDEVYERMNSDSEENFEAIYEAGDEDEDGDMGVEATVENVVISPTVSQPIDVSPFMCNLDLDAMHAPKFSEFANIGT